MLKHFIRWLNPIWYDIRILRSDNLKEYIDTKFQDCLTENEIVGQTCVNTPWQNGIAERNNRHLMEIARALIFTRNIPIYLWGDAILTAAYLINRMPSDAVNF